MTQNEIEQMIVSSPSYENFIIGSRSHLDIIVGGVRTYVFKNIDSTVDLYYQLPYSPNMNYDDVRDYMKYAIPFLSKCLKEHDIENL